MRKKTVSIPLLDKRALCHKTDDEAAPNFQRRSLLAAAFCFLSGAASAAGENALKIGIDASYPPYTFYNENKVLSGIDPALAREACRRLGIMPIFVPIRWDRKADYFADKSIDCVWSCFTMTGRESEYRWVPYLYSRQVVVVRKESSVQHLCDLAGKTLALQSGTRPEQYFTREAEKAPAIKNFMTFKTMQEAFIAVRSGYAEATAGHEAVMQRLLQEVPDEYRILDEPLLAVKVGVAFPINTDRPTVVKQLGEALAAMTEDGFIARTAVAFGLSAKVVLPISS